MDLKKRVNELEPGMILSRSISVNDIMLMPPGTSLDSEDIERLQDWNVRIVFVELPATRKIA